MKEKINNNDGLTLIEVVASIVLIGIVMGGFAYLFINANTTANYNNEKLILVNIADAELERLQSMGELSTAELTDYINAHKTHDMNGKTYEVQFDYTTKLAGNTDNITNGFTSIGEADLNLQNIKVTVSLKDSPRNISSSSEGYIILKK